MKKFGLKPRLWFWIEVNEAGARPADASTGSFNTKTAGLNLARVSG